MHPIQWLPIIECILIAFAGGMVFGVFGSGSGLIMTPGFYYVLHRFAWANDHRMQMAVATTAAASAILGGFSARIQYKKGHLDPVTIKRTFWGLLVGTLTAIFLATIIPSFVLKKIFGVIVILVAIWLYRYQSEQDKKKWSLHSAWNYIFTFVIGLLWFLLGVAVFVGPYLHKCGINLRKSIGSASFISAFYSAIATLLFMLVGHFTVGSTAEHIGYVNLTMLAIAVIPGTLGGYIGSHISVRIPPHSLKYIYAILVFVVGLLMII